MNEVLAAHRFYESVKIKTEARLVAGAGVLNELADQVLLCRFPNDNAREAVTYATFCFLARMTEAHDGAPQFTNTYSNLFTDRVSEPLQRAAAFLVKGGPADAAVEIISIIRRTEAELSERFPGY